MSLRLETRRLLVRDVREDDAAAIAGLWADPEVTRWLGGPREPGRVEESVRRAAAAPPELDLWSVELSGRVVGSCGLVEKTVEGREELELIYVIARPQWGAGLATEAAAAVRDHAFGALGRRRLIALIHPEHPASARVAAKLGFVRQGSVPRPGGRRLDLHACER